MFNLTPSYQSFFIFTTSLSARSTKKKKSRRHDARMPLPARFNLLAKALQA